ncbi:sensor histidine kinase [Paenibacillus sp. A14]|uniref:sensor histidine kinase n=1 Tax=Paenibacillus sp. A14 TaxID=3119820 RepID=UPI002FE3BE22
MIQKSILKGYLERLKNTFKNKLVLQFTFHFLLNQLFLGFALAIPYITYTILVNVVQDSPVFKLDAPNPLIVLITYLIYCFIYGYKAGYPLYEIIRNIKQLAEGEYAQRKEKSRGFFMSSRLYKDVKSNLDHLSSILQINETKRKEFERERQEWAAGITHDLKTPLSYISGYTDMLLSDQHQWSEQEKQKFLQLIRDKATYIHELIEDLGIAFRMDESAASHLKADPIDLVELIRRVTAEMLNMSISKDYSIQMTTYVNRLYVQGDAKLLHRAFSNLMVNAMSHNPPGTHIEITVHKTASAQVQIKDNGKGMDEQLVSHIFDRYYRGTSTGTHTGGTGLGMAIVKQVVSAHQGNIYVNSQVGQGTDIMVEIPLLPYPSLFKHS